MRLLRAAAKKKKGTARTPCLFSIANGRGIGRLRGCPARRGVPPSLPSRGRGTSRPASGPGRSLDSVRRRRGGKATRPRSPPFAGHKSDNVRVTSAAQVFDLACFAGVLVSLAGVVAGVSVLPLAPSVEAGLLASVSAFSPAL